MPKTYTFRAVIVAEGSGGAYVTVPFDVEEEFGKKRVKIKAAFDGEPYRGSLVRMGGDDHILLVLKEIRARIGKEAGDEVEVTLEEDLEPRVIEIPADLRAALEGDPEAGAYFDGMSYTRRRETVMWIEAAKRPETRSLRIAKSIELLRAGKPPR
jgi:hypothetical protein